MKIADNNDASNGKFVTDMAFKDVLKYAYHAKKAGTYHVVMRYRSGSEVSAKNGIKITEVQSKITEKQLKSTRQKKGEMLFLEK